MGEVERDEHAAQNDRARSAVENNRCLGRVNLKMVCGSKKSPAQA
jgi:hypothetical protein